jgi:hypothetical protein
LLALVKAPPEAAVVSGSTRRAATVVVSHAVAHAAAVLAALDAVFDDHVPLPKSHLPSAVPVVWMLEAVMLPTVS